MWFIWKMIVVVIFLFFTFFCCHQNNINNNNKKKSLALVVDGASTKCDLPNRACTFAGIICISSVYLITTDTEYQTVCRQILGSINITVAHWGGIQPISGPKLWAALHGIRFNELDNPRLVQVIGSALQQMCCQTIINLKLLSQCSLLFRLLNPKDRALQYVRAKNINEKRQHRKERKGKSIIQVRPNSSCTLFLWRVSGQIYQEC